MTPIEPRILPLDCPHPWTPDRGDGTYANPVICADYSDPDVIRDGEDFWLVASSFNCTPGLPILHSRDLVNWAIVNHAIKNNPDPRGVFDTPQHGCGVWAPAIRKHAGLFWIFFPMPDEGLYVTTATDPRGAWSEPWRLLEGKGFIDPCPLWDDDGRAYLVHAFANSRCGIKHRLRVIEMSPDAKRLIGDGRIVFDAPERHPTCEGPKFHKRNGWYYLSAPAGGVKFGWQLILRSRDPFGPYEEKVVLAQRDTPINGPHQGAIVEMQNAECRTRNADSFCTPHSDFSTSSHFLHFQDADVFGRIVHLQPVRWEDDWPLIGIDQDANGLGKPVLIHRKPIDLGAAPIVPPVIPQTSDDFSSPALGLQWQWHANHRDDWHSLTRPPGSLRLRAVKSSDQFDRVPNLLLQKFPATRFAVEADIELESTEEHIDAGLIVMGQTHAALSLTHRAGKPLVRLLVNDVETAWIELPQPRATALLRVAVDKTGLCQFSVGTPAGYAHFGKPFQATPGKWIGAKVGVWCRSTSDDAKGGAVVRSFRVLPS